MLGAKQVTNYNKDSERAQSFYDVDLMGKATKKATKMLPNTKN